MKNSTISSRPFSYVIFWLSLSFLTLSACDKNKESETGLAGEINQLVEQHHNQSRAAGTTVLVRRDGVNVYRKSFGFVDTETKTVATPEHLYGIGSITKPIVAGAILSLIYQGDLGLNDTVGDVLSDYTGPAKSVTIYQLLTHSGGVYDFPNSALLIDDGLGFTREQTLSLFQDEPLDFVPGTAWGYSSSGYYILGLILERKTGKSIDAALNELFLKPIGAQHTQMNWQSDIIPNRARGYKFNAAGDLVNDFMVDAIVAFSAGALISTVDDLAKIAESKSSNNYLAVIADKVQRKGVPAIDEITDSTYLPSGLFYERQYGYEKFYHSGRVSGFQAHMSYYPDPKLTIIILQNTVNTSPSHVDLDREISDLIFSHLGAKE